MKQFGDITKTKHSYEIGTVIDGVIAKVTVHANTRSQAAKELTRVGLVVRDVNMVG